MNILMVIKRFKPDTLFGGAERSAYRLACALSEGGVGVDVASARLHPGWPGKEEISCRKATIRVVRFLHPPVRMLGTILYNLRLFLHILFNRNYYQVIHVHFASFEMFTAVAAKLTGGPPVLCKIACSGQTGEIAIAGRRFYAPLFNWFLRRVDVLVALSPEIRNELADCGVESGQIIIIPNGVDTRYFSPPDEGKRKDIRSNYGISPDETVMVFAGRLSPQKGLKTLLKAIARLDNPSVKLMLAGRGPQRKELQSLALKLGIENRVRFMGEVKDIRSLYYASDIFVLPSYYEGLSNSLLEAMSTGMKIVATRVSGSSEVIENGRTGVLAEPGNHLSVAVAISAALSLNHHTGKQARRKILNKYSSEKVAQRYRETYQKLQHSA